MQKSVFRFLVFLLETANTTCKDVMVQENYYNSQY